MTMNDSTSCFDVTQDFVSTYTTSHLQIPCSSFLCIPESFPFFFKAEPCLNHYTVVNNKEIGYTILSTVSKPGRYILHLFFYFNVISLLMPWIWKE